ncbi:MAG: AraC family transcriptional regulator [Burkholderiaceae bacterium]
MKQPLRACLALAAAIGLCAAAAFVAAPVHAADAPPPAAVAPASSASAALAAMPAASAAEPAAAASAPDAAASAPAGSLDDRIQATKADVIALNRDLMVLEEELLFPANTQVAVFVSMDVGLMFDLDSVQIKVDDKLVSNYLYTPLEVQALHRGGVQRVYLGDLRAGPHEIVAFFTGKGPHDRDYRRATTIKFDKTTEPKYIELQIKDVQQKLQPEFDVKVWQ